MGTLLMVGFVMGIRGGGGGREGEGEGLKGAAQGQTFVLGIFWDFGNSEIIAIKNFK